MTEILWHGKAVRALLQRQDYWKRPLRFGIVMMNANCSTMLPWNIYGDQRDSTSCRFGPEI